MFALSASTVLFNSLTRHNTPLTFLNGLLQTVDHEIVASSVV